MIEIHKIIVLNYMIQITQTNFLNYVSPRAKTRGHDFNLKFKYGHKNVWKISFPLGAYHNETA